MRYIRNLFAKQTPTLLSWRICLSIDLMFIISPLETNTKTLVYSDQYRQPTRHLGGNGVKGNRWLQLLLLREDRSVNNTPITSHYAKYANVFEKQTTKLLSWRIYISIDFMVTTLFTLRTTGRPKRHYFEKQLWRIVVSSRNKLLSQGYIHYVKVDIWTNKPLHVLVRLRLSCSVSLLD